MRDVARLSFIRRAKALGFTLSEIRDLLALSSYHENDMSDLRGTAMEKLAGVEIRISELLGIRDGLRTLIAICPSHGALSQCPILGALAEETA